MKILVFGKTGQVAQALQRCRDVVALGRNEADLTNPVACAEIIAKTDADVVINAAAYTAVDRAQTEQELAKLVNTTAPAAMARAAAKRKIPFLHLSSDYVFDGHGTIPFSPETTTAPLGVYGRTKRDGELGITAANGAHVILRTSWVFSANGSNFVKTMLRLGSARANLNVVADQIGGPTFADDIADALLTISRAFVCGRGQTGVFHFTGTPDVSWADFAREIFVQTTQNIQISDIPTSAYPTPAMRPQNSRLDCASLNAAYRIKRPNWHDGLAKVLQDIRKA